MERNIVKILPGLVHYSFSQSGLLESNKAQWYKYGAVVGTGHKQELATNLLDQSFLLLIKKGGCVAFRCILLSCAICYLGMGVGRSLSVQKLLMVELFQCIFVVSHHGEMDLASQGYFQCISILFSRVSNGGCSESQHWHQMCHILLILILDTKAIYNKCKLY